MHDWLVGGMPTPLKNISQLGLLFPIYGQIKNVPNHHPGLVVGFQAISMGFFSANNHIS